MLYSSSPFPVNHPNGELKMKTHTINTAMREAFIKSFDKVRRSSPVVDKVLASLDTHAGVIKRNDWNASLSFKTAQTLKAQGILA